MTVFFVQFSNRNRSFFLCLFYDIKHDHTNFYDKKYFGFTWSMKRKIKLAHTGDKHNWLSCLTNTDWRSLAANVFTKSVLCSAAFSIHSEHWRRNRRDEKSKPSKLVELPFISLSWAIRSQLIKRIGYSG